jgi:release factor glutamine methyltransferase
VKSVRQLLAEAGAQLSGEEARAEAMLLLAHALGVTQAWLVAHADDPIEPWRATAFLDLVLHRAKGEPVAYLTGTRGFHALHLHVTPDVLIPRPETELLVELALQRVPVDCDCAVADLGTGSGAVALAIASQRPRARVLATDASTTALNVARENAARLGLHNVAFAAGDWYVAFGDSRFDLVVSNPPYIAEGDPHLEQDDLRFEPRAALASGVDGLDAIRVIVSDSRGHLRPGGWLLFEHGYDQGAAARDLLIGNGYWDVFTERDLEGRERVSGGRSGSAPEVDP